MATVDEILSGMPEEEITTEVMDDAFVIDPNTRLVHVPESEAVFGVMSDEAAERKRFRCARIVGNGLDLSSSVVRVNFRNANAEADSYIVTDVTVIDENVEFTWELSRKVTSHQGDIHFIVCAVNGDKEWNTTLATGKVLEGLEPEVDGDAVEETTSDVIAQLVSMVVTQTETVRMEGAVQVNAVQDAAMAATVAARDEIKAKGTNTLASIPDDYTALSEAVNGLVRTAAPGIVCEAEGSVVTVSDASDNHIQSLRIFGRSTQDGTPTPDAPVEIVSVEAPTVTVCGRNLWNHENDTVDMLQLSGWGSAIWRTDAVIKTLQPNTTYTMRFTVTCLAVPEYESVFSDDCGFVLYSPQESGRFITLAMSKGEGALSVGEKRTATCTFTTPENVRDASMGYEILRYVQRYKLADGTAVYATAKFEDMQLELGDTVTEYEPYSGQTIATTHTLPGIPVTSGGNYTDENGQQWICDEVDLERGVYVRRVGNVVLDGSADEHWYTVNATGGIVFAYAIADALVDGSSKKVCCTHFVPSVNGVYNKTENACYFYDKTFRVCHLAVDTLDGFKAWLFENPITVAYPLDAAVETPLSETEIAAYRALHTNKPNTTVLNDAGAHMAVAYVADTKLYIDNKIAALTAQA